MTVSEETIATVMELADAARKAGGYRYAYRCLLEARNECRDADAARAAEILLNDYNHLKDGGCHPGVAMMITLTQPEDLA